MSLFPMKQLFRAAMSIAFSRKNMLAYVLVGILPQITITGIGALYLAVAGGNINQLLSSLGVFPFLGIMALALIPASIIGFWYSAFLYHFYMATTDKQPTVLSELLRKGWQSMLRVAKTTLLMTLSIVLSSLLFIIPGLIVAVWFFFGPLISVVEPDNHNPLKASKRLTAGRFWAVGGRILLITLLYQLPLSLLGKIHPFLGILWSSMSSVTGLLYYLLYLDLRRTKKTLATAAQSHNSATSAGSLPS